MAIVKKQHVAKKKKKTVVSLFCGIGGIDSAFEQAGFKIIWANDSDKNALDTYKLNFGNFCVLDDIKNINSNNVPKGDVLTFGFPCQSFSIAGYRKGFKDKKNGHLFFEALRIIQKTKPSVIFLENVKNLISHNKGKTFKKILDELSLSKYYCTYQVINSKEYGNVCQNRERIYLVGFKNKKHFNKFHFPKPISLTKKITDITRPNLKKDDWYYYDQKYKNFLELKEKVLNKNSAYQWRRVYVRENKSGVFPTLTANMGTGGHNIPIVIDNYGIRKITIEEALKLQGFSKHYKIPDLSKSQIYKQIGNSVTVSVVKRIAENILKSIN